MIRQFSPNIRLGRVRWGLVQADELRRLTTFSNELREKHQQQDNKSMSRMSKAK